jgi:hypothetical protein
MPTELNALSAFEGVHPRIAPTLIVQGHAYVLNPFDLATLGVSRLGDIVASFADDDQAMHKVPDALDAILKPY